MLKIKYKNETHVFPTGELSTNKTEQGRYEENLHIFAMQCMNDIFRHLPGICDQPGGVPSMMFALPHIAKYYGIDRNILLKQWTQDYGIYYAMKMIPNPHDRQEVAI